MRSRWSLSFLSLFLLVTLSTAWPFRRSYDDVAGRLFGRQNTVSGAPATTEATPSNTGSATATATATATGDSSAAAPTESNTDSAAATTGGGATATSGQSTGNSTTHHANKTTVVDPRLPPGGIELITPAAIAPPQYYKIGDYVTFAWNYTSLSVTPSAVDVMASCAVNSQLYPISLNQSVGPTGAVTWDTGKYQSTATIPLLTETYTLVVFDAAGGVSSTPQAGYLAVQDQWTFGMYIPEPYVPLNEFKCATCSAALSAHERHALGFVLAMSVITVLSFTWFAGGFGVFG